MHVGQSACARARPTSQSERRESCTDSQSGACLVHPRAVQSNQLRAMPRQYRTSAQTGKTCLGIDRKKKPAKKSSKPTIVNTMVVLDADSVIPPALGSSGMTSKQPAGQPTPPGLFTARGPELPQLRPGSQYLEPEREVSRDKKTSEKNSPDFSSTKYLLCLFLSAKSRPVS